MTEFPVFSILKCQQNLVLYPSKFSASDRRYELYYCVDFRRGKPVPYCTDYQRFGKIGCSHSAGAKLKCR